MIRVCMYLEGLDRGGIETLCVNLIEPMRELDCELSFLILKELPYAYTDMVKGHGCSIDYLVKSDDAESSGGVDYCRLFYKWARDHANDFDVLHMHISQLANSLPLMVAARMGGLKNVVLHAHNSKPSNKKIGFAHRVCLPVLPIVRPSAMLACSDVAGSWMFGASPYIKIANGVNLERFKFNQSARVQIRNEFDLVNDVVLCCVCRFAKVKNLAFLLDVFSAFRELQPDSHLLLVGGGELEGDLRKKAAKLGLQGSVIFTGVRNDVQDILSASDCLVFPTLFEGLSIACVEAQANGIPAVLSDGVSPETVMSSKTAIMPLSCSPREWAEKILSQVERRFENPCYADSFAEYDIHSSAASIVEVYRNVLSVR